ncbi:MAG: NAD(P)H-hydrate epimerase, partial [Acidobacteriota bacterium]|nr:NAD(P)H-hydrate epimerase [Acidobacteriota bacterium]
MQKVVTAEEMREIDRLTTEKYGIPSILLMENAAHAATRIITEKLGGSVEGKSFLILCGKGNNGGDGAALARILWTLGADVDVYLFGKVEETKNDARVNFEILKKTNFEETSKDRDYNDKSWDKSFLFFHEEENPEWWRKRITPLHKADVVVDALFGTGLTRPIEESLKRVIESHWFEEKALRDSLFLTASLDIPSGLDSNLAKPIGENIQVDLTITFTAPKPANVLPPASNFNGELVVANIGSPQELIDNSPSKLFLAERKDAQSWLERTKFTVDSYKNKRGHALLIVGSREYTGAAVLAGNAAMLSGVGLTTIATSESAQTAIAAKVLEEVITRSLPETKNGAVAKQAFA